MNLNTIAKIWLQLFLAQNIIWHRVGINFRKALTIPRAWERLQGAGALLPSLLFFVIKGTNTDFSLLINYRRLNVPFDSRNLICPDGRLEISCFMGRQASTTKLKK